MVLFLVTHSKSLTEDRFKTFEVCKLLKGRLQLIADLIRFFLSAHAHFILFLFHFTDLLSGLFLLRLKGLQLLIEALFWRCASNMAVLYAQICT